MSAMPTPGDKPKEALLATPGLISKDGNIVGPAQEVWQKVAAALNNKLKATYLYAFFHENRHDTRNEYCIKYNIANNNIQIACSSDDEEDDPDEAENGDNQPPIKEFLIQVEPETWINFFKPVMQSYQSKNGGFRNTLVLPLYKWEDKLVELLWQTHKLPCSYEMQHSPVSLDAHVYIRVKAKCNKCNATATGTVPSEPNKGEYVTIIWKAPDTTNIPHIKK